MRFSGEGMPTRDSISTARASAAARSRPRWVRIASTSWNRTVYTGLSDVMGSWKIMEISLPRSCRSRAAPARSRSSPLYTIRPAIRPGGNTRPMIDSEVTLLPLPDSPTIDSTSPLPAVNDTLSTACTRPRLVGNTVLRFSTESSM